MHDVAFRYVNIESGPNWKLAHSHRTLTDADFEGLSFNNWPEWLDSICSAVSSSCGNDQLLPVPFEFFTLNLSFENSGPPG